VASPDLRRRKKHIDCLRCALQPDSSVIRPSKQGSEQPSCFYLTSDNRTSITLK